MAPKVVSREIVKPSSSNLNDHPKIHNLSFFDQISSGHYKPLLFFYKNSTKNDDYNQKSSVLKVSLSAALSRYYPLAGREKDDNVTVLHCNDEGALFLEARMEANLCEILKNPDNEILKPLFPDSLYYKDSTRNSHVAVQVTYFQCGGMSIGLCLSHKTMDMASMTSFISDWASLARNSEEKISSPMFDIGSLYPPLDLPIPKKKQEAPPEMKDCVPRRFVFDGSKIAKLKEMVADQVPNPTRVEVVTALLYKAAVSANAKVAGSLKPNSIALATNLRSRVCPPVSERNIGNMSWAFRVTVREVVELELGLLVNELRNAKNEFFNSCANITNKEDLCTFILKGIKPISEGVENELYSCTSWCRYPFYESDFGWGKPLWAATVLFKLKNTISFIDTKEGDGIEAFICLEEKAMDVFLNDQELLSFCSVNPIVLDE